MVMVRGLLSVVRLLLRRRVGGAGGLELLARDLAPEQASEAHHGGV